MCKDWQWQLSKEERGKVMYEVFAEDWSASQVSVLSVPNCAAALASRWQPKGPSELPQTFRLGIVQAAPPRSNMAEQRQSSCVQA